MSVFETYQRWQLELERQPVQFLGRRADDLLDNARASLADYLHAKADELIFVPNATIGINTVARSLPLQTGDEILTTDHEYGAMDYTWEFVCKKTGARYVRHAIPLPVTSAEELVEAFWHDVTPRTKVIFISHITSPTALIFPVKQICQRARAAGIWTVVDGAHVPGQLPLDLEDIGADFYSGNCHKWLCSPKGSAFLNVRAEHHHLIDPLVISWGYPDDTPQNRADTHSPFVRRNQWQGTRDIAAFLSIPAAIEFQKAHDWGSVRQACHALASETRQRLSDLFALPVVSPDSPEWFMQLFTARLPDCDEVMLKKRLYDEFHVEVPITVWSGQKLVRVSIQAYNSREDADALINALSRILD